MDNTTSPLTDLPEALRQAGFAPPAYRHCYEMARSARLPVQRAGNGRWVFRKAELHQIAQALGLTPVTAS